MWNEMRRVAENSTALYFKRFYPDGRVRPVRLPSTKFMRDHIDRAAASQAQLDTPEAGLAGAACAP